MSDQHAQRRRVAIAAAITVIAVPAAFLLNDRDSSESTSEVPEVTMVGGAPAVGGAATSPVPTTGPDADDTADAPAGTDAMGTAPVAYLDGTVPPDDDDPPTIAIPRERRSITGSATFRRGIESPEICQVLGVPYQATVTITNLDNSRSVQCRVTITSADQRDDVILHTDAFTQIADITDVPVPVEINW